MRKEIINIALTGIIALLFFSCIKRQEFPVDFAVTSVDFSYEISLPQDSDTIGSATVTINCRAESHPDYGGNIEDYSDKAFWKISLFKTSSYPDITGEETSFGITEGTSAVYTHTFDFVTGDEVSLEAFGKFQVQYASDLKKVYRIICPDTLSTAQ